MPVLEVLAQVRRAKTEAKVSQRAEVAEVIATVPAAEVTAVEAGRADLIQAGSIRAVTIVPSDAAIITCTVTLAATDGA